MNTDQKLKEVLQGWQVIVPLPADFTRSVWQRIADRPEEDRLVIFKRFFSRISELMVMPRYASTMAMVVVLVGVSFGYMQGNASAATTWTQLEAKYADSINPLSPNHLMANR